MVVHGFDAGSAVSRFAPVPPSRAYRRSFSGDFAGPVAAAAGIATPTARGRFVDWGWKGDRWVEEITAVILRCLVAPADLQVKRFAGRKVDGDTAAAWDRTVLYRMLLEHGEYGGTSGASVRASVGELWWGEKFGFLAGADFVPVILRLRRVLERFRRGHRTTVRFRPGMDRQGTAIRASWQRVVVEIWYVEYGRFSGIFGDGGIWGMGGRWPNRVPRRNQIAVIILGGALLV